MADELIKCEFLGVDEVNRMLDSIPKELVMNGYLEALRDGSDVIVQELDARTPIQLIESGGELIVEGGDLKGSIVTEIILDANYQGGVALVGFGKLGYIARFVEFGHHMIGHVVSLVNNTSKGSYRDNPSKKYLGEVEAHPFMRPATAAAYERVVIAVGEAITRTVRRVFPQGGS